MAVYKTEQNDSIVLGSGELYMALESATTGKSGTELDAVLVKIGAIEGGAEIAYKPKSKEIKMANRNKIMIREDEEASFKTGVMNFVVSNLNYLAPVKTEDIMSTDVTPVKLGTKVVVGGQNIDPICYLKFIHEEADGSKIVVRMPKCQCTNGFKFSFDRDNPIVLDYEFESLTGMSKDGAMQIEFVDAPVAP